MAPRKTPKSNLKPKWRKVLYEKQGLPDNYVDESFLKDLQKNLHVKLYTTLYAFRETGVVTQEISSVAIFAVTFVHLENNSLQALPLFIGSSLAVLLSYILYKFLICSAAAPPNVKRRTYLDDAKSASFFLLFGFGLSPILKTLTDTVSTDTIYAMSTLMMLIHLIFHDYGLSGPLVSSSISLNAAIFSAVCLASRLSTVEDAFVLLTFSVKLFALFSIFRQSFQISRTSVALTMAMFLFALSVLYTISTTAAIQFLVVIVFVNIICPACFVYWQSYKENIHGPWDEAVLNFAQ